MTIIKTLMPMWELLSIISNWVIVVVFILFILCIGVILFFHFIIENNSDDIGENIIYKRRMKKCVIYFLPILFLVSIIRIILEIFISL